MSLLLNIRDEETGQAMDDRQLRDEVMTLLIAGHETTAMTLSWTWYLLSMHPHVQRQLSHELASVLAGRSPCVDDLPNLPYTRMVIEESMRLYPAVWALSRQAIEPDVIQGYSIPAGTPVVMLQ